MSAGGSAPCPGLDRHILFLLEKTSGAEDAARIRANTHYLEGSKQGLELSSLPVWKPPERSVTRTCLLVAVSVAGSYRYIGLNGQTEAILAGAWDQTKQQSILQMLAKRNC